MKLYENVIIGNFLYTLGLNIGINKELPKYSSINLLQQTPADYNTPRKLNKYF